MDPTDDELLYIVNHIFLPPKLPFKEEHGRHNQDSALSRYISSIADEFKALLNKSDKEIDQVWGTICRMLETTHFINASLHLNQEKLKNSLQQMKVNDVIPIYIKAQNAAVIFRKPSDKHLTFEFFEVSLPNHTVMHTTGKVAVQYPANSRLLVNNNEDILSTISNLLSFFDTENPTGNDPIGPKYISEAVAGIVRALSPAQSDTITTTYIRKRIEDRVLGSSDSEQLVARSGSNDFSRLVHIIGHSEVEFLAYVVGPLELKRLVPILLSGCNRQAKFLRPLQFMKLFRSTRSSKSSKYSKSKRRAQLLLSLESERQAQLQSSEFKRLAQLLGPARFERLMQRLWAAEEDGDYDQHSLTYSAGLSAYRHWRRSPMWLILRVAIQSTLSDAGLGEAAEYGYKAFQAFLMSKVLDTITSQSRDPISGDIIYLMNAKLARRLVKLGDLVEAKTSTPVNIARETVHRVASFLEQRWQEIQKACTNPIDWVPPTEADIEESLQLSLPNSNRYLRDVMGRTEVFAGSSSGYNDVSKSRALVNACSNRLSHDHPELPQTINKEEPVISLYDFEAWVEFQLPAWSQRLDHTEEDCQAIATILGKYLSVAGSHYCNAPERYSVMYLCLMELWVAFDKLAVKFIPLLSDYLPEVPFNFLEPLLLPRMSHMQRLHRLENYIQARHDAAVKKGGHSAFGNMDLPHSFQNRYFESSATLQDFKRRIEEWGARMKAATLQKMEALNKKYSELIQRAYNRSCISPGYQRHYYERLCHDLGCQKCRLERKARRISMNGFQEPLPRDRYHAQALVFEVKCPPVFDLWRKTTSGVLRRSILPPGQDSYLQMAIRYLSSILTWESPRRGIHSSYRSTYRFVRIPATEGQVISPFGEFVPHPPSLSAKDHAQPLLCTFQLEGQYGTLQKFISGTSHTSNEVIASRSACPASLHVGEQDVFGHLRSGNRLQWRNIMRALVSSSLSFSEPGVYSLIMQSIWQVGPRGEEEVLREAHADLYDDQFCAEVVDELRESLKNIGDNDKKHFHLAILNAIASRLHALSSSVDIKEAALKFLEDSRELALRWIDLISKEQLEFEGTKVAECRSRSTQVALVYRSSFDIEDTAVSKLFESPDNLTGFIRALIVIQSNMTSGQPHSHGFQCLFRRDQHLAYRTESHVVAAIRQNPSALDLAVKSGWPAYIAGRPWSPLHAPGTRWWKAKSKEDGDTRSRVVHLNILDGTLLVDGQPIGGLPSAYLTHPTYKLLFPSQTLNPRPSTMHGMEYEVDYAGRQVHLLMVGKDLIVRTRGQFGLEEFIPASKLDQDIPSELIKGRIHWYLEQTNEISFRPATCVWEADPQSHWSMALTGKGNLIFGGLYKHTLGGIQRVVCPYSVVQQKLVRTFHALEPTPLRITTFLESENEGHKSKLRISLYRHSFEFFINEAEELECQNLPNFVVDKEQVRTSLFGLKNAIFLRKNVGSCTQRKLFIPRGEVRVTGTYLNHPVVEIDSFNSSGIFVYDVDELVGRYVGNYTFSSECLLILLHALTSSYLPDPLTRRTGTEEALDRLSSAFIVSYPARPGNWRDELNAIASVTPQRAFYTGDMEDISWNYRLPVTSQHPNFYVVSRKILNEWNRIDAVCQGIPVNSYQLPFHPNELLNNKARLRLLTHGSTGSVLVGENHTRDTIHTHRDSSCNLASKDREYLSYQVAMAVLHAGNGLSVCGNLDSVIRQWSVVAKPNNWKWEDLSCWFTTNMPAAWRTLYDLCRADHGCRSSKIVAAFGLLAYQGQSLPLLGTLISVLHSPVVQETRFEFRLTCDLQMSEGEAFKRSQLQSILLGQQISLYRSNDPKPRSEPRYTYDQRRRQAEIEYQNRVDADIQVILDHLQNMWPNVPDTIYIPRQQRLRIDTAFIRNRIHPPMQHWSRNHFFLEHIRLIRDAVRQSTLTSPLAINRYPNDQIRKYSSAIQTIDLEFLFRTRFLSERIDTVSWDMVGPKASQDTGACQGKLHLTRLYERLISTTSGPLEKQYALHLAASLNAFKDGKSANEFTIQPSSISFDHNEERSKRLASVISTIRGALSGALLVERMAEAAGLWPRITPKILLRRLSLKERNYTSANWISIISHLAEHIISVQQGRRLNELVASNRKEYYNEVMHSRKRKQEDDLDWLLIEIDSNVSMREEQVQIAKAMMKPDTGENAVMQLNMGQGKSSVIVPAVAASLADTTRLVRVLVLKPQAKQQLRLLQWRLSDLSNRSVIQIPFNRNISLDTTSAPLILELMKECQRRGGVWLCQPEQLLSFKILGLDTVVRNRSKPSVGQQLISTQIWLQRNVRDILDESDEILHPRNQLVYTVGDQRLIDAGSARWEIVQNFLDLFHRYLKNERNPTFLVSPCQEFEQFPQIRIASEEAKVTVLYLAHRIIWEEDMPSLSFKHFPSQFKSAACRFVVDRDVQDRDADYLRQYCKDNGETFIWRGLLLLRALLAFNLLVSILQGNRFRVDYGLDLRRTQLAVPYRAKDSPSLRSNFAHPDVTILLTCLSYYYHGLTTSMIAETLKQLMKYDAPDQIYQQWISSYSSEVPPALRTLPGIDINDHSAISRILKPILQYNKKTIDFFLDTCVFPKEAMEFPFKMSTTAWDIAMKKEHLTTGFSGTNDSRFLLPTSIEQRDDPRQLHTNAQVLATLLQEENSEVVQHANNLSTEELLDLVMKLTPNRPTVFLDVGAQVLDSSNKEFAMAWLNKYDESSPIKAAIFFDEDDHVCTITRDGTVQPLPDSPYLSRMDECLVYLDDIHTRGTDLKLPACRAAVTLGPKLTKDKLAQGCMRMRKLGTEHSVVFLAPQEVISSIRKATNLSSDQPKTSDVLLWTMMEACRQLKGSLPNWASQGHEFATRAKNWEQVSKLGGAPTVEWVKRIFYEPGSQTLEEMYDPKSRKTTIGALQYLHSADTPNSIVRAIIDRCKALIPSSMRDDGIRAEHEYEIIRQTETRKEVKVTPTARPVPHHLHPDVKSFVVTGHFNKISSGFLNVSRSLAQTSLKIPKGTQSAFENLFVTADFARTVLPLSSSTQGCQDDFLRPVEWVVTPKSDAPDKVVLLSPFEVNELFPIFRKSPHVNLHVYAARSSHPMRTLEELVRFTLPISPSPVPRSARLTQQLNLYSGTLYLQDYKTYKEVCRILRLHFGALPPQIAEIGGVDSNGFVGIEDAQRVLGITGAGFTESSILFLRQFILLRRHGRSFLPSHMGQILYGLGLKEDHFSPVGELVPPP